MTTICSKMRMPLLFSWQNGAFLIHKYTKGDLSLFIYNLMLNALYVAFTVYEDIIRARRVAVRPFQVWEVVARLED